MGQGSRETDEAMHFVRLRHDEEIPFLERNPLADETIATFLRYMGSGIELGTILVCSSR